MQVFRVLENHPAAVLAAAAVGFAAWVAANPPQSRARPVPQVEVVSVPDKAALMPPPPANGSCTPLTLAMLRPGMPRVEVEGLLGAPPADLVMPFDPGSATYLTGYPALFGPIPVAVFERRVLPSPTPDTRVAVEFDATRPGHPLVRVHYPDPLF
jgi:hypothetical protein